MLNDWARGFRDRDGKFVQEFQRTFDSCFWELYVFAVLKQYRLEVDFTRQQASSRLIPAQHDSPVSTSSEHFRHLNGGSRVFAFLSPT